MGYWSGFWNFIEQMRLRLSSELTLGGVSLGDVAGIARHEHAKGNPNINAAVDEAKEKAKERKRRSLTSLRWEQPRRVIPEPPQQIQQVRATGTSSTKSITPPGERPPAPSMMAHVEARAPARIAELPGVVNAVTTTNSPINWAARFETAYQEIRAEQEAREWAAAGRASLASIIAEREAREAAQPVTELHNAERGDVGQTSTAGIVRQAAELPGGENRGGASEMSADWAAACSAALASIKAEREAAEEERAAGRPTGRPGQVRSYGYDR